LSHFVRRAFHIIRCYT